MADTQTWEDFLAVENVLEMSDVTSDITAALQPQYSHAKRFRGMAKTFQDAIDATPELKSFYDAIANPETAKGVFLDWWGERIGVDRNILVNGDYQRFDDDYFRFLIYYRAACNVATDTAEAANQLLSRLTDTTVFVVDYQDMTISSVVVIGAISDVMSTVLATYGLLNRPAGVLANYLVIYPNEEIFGFQGSDLLPFNQGVFNPGRTIQVQT